MAISVVVDSTADLPPETAQELGIRVAPLAVLFGEDAYRDGLDLTGAEFYAKLKGSPVMPTTSAPSPGLFEEVYRDAINAGATGILELSIASTLSATYSVAKQVAEMVAAETNVPIEVIDSRTVSMGFGLPAEIVAREAREGASLADLKAHAEEPAESRSTLRHARYAGVPATRGAHRARAGHRRDALEPEADPAGA